MKELHKLQMLAQKKVHSDVRRLTFYCKTNTISCVKQYVAVKKIHLYIQEEQSILLNRFALLYNQDITQHSIGISTLFLQ